MKKLLLSIVLIGFSILFINSCKDESTLDEDFQVEFGFEYFPLEIGKFKEYRMDSTTYDIGTSSVIIKTQSTTYAREEVADTITDNLGRLGYKIERFEKKNLADAWEIKDVWMMLRTESQAESLEENLRFIKMVFPLKENLVWDGNRFIDTSIPITIAGENLEMFKSWEYEVQFVGEPIVVNNEIYDEAVEITQADNENLIELRQSKEQYIKDIGLAYRELWILDTQDISSPAPWDEKAEKGFILYQTLINHN